MIFATIIAPSFISLCVEFWQTLRRLRRYSIRNYLAIFDSDDALGALCKGVIVRHDDQGSAFSVELIEQGFNLCAGF